MNPAADLARALLFGLLVLGSSVTMAQDGRTPLLFERMNAAIRSLDYEGTLVYLFENRLETLHLVHRVDDGTVQERLLSLSGPVRALTRERGRVTCVMADGHPISVKSHAGRNLLRSERIDPQALGERYGIELEGAARVAGRDTDVVAILPSDPLRYGYRFHLDRETGLPLKSDLIDHLGESVEQLMFTAITFHQGASGALARTAMDEGSVAPKAGTADALEVEGAPTSRWRFDERPLGFEQTTHGTMVTPNGQSVEHFVFADGLSAYSVYIEADTRDGLDGVTRVGAVHAAGRTVDGHQVTAVGQVPAAAVEAAVAGARLMPAGDP